MDMTSTLICLAATKVISAERQKGQILDFFFFCNMIGITLEDLCPSLKTV